MSDPIYAGPWSVLPPLVSIAFALFTKNIISSLFLGIFTGTLIYSFFLKANLIVAFKLIFNVLEHSISSNVLVIIFISLLGALSQIMINSGGASGYTKWAEKKIKSARLAQFSSVILALLFSIDDFFSCLTVGSIMRPIMDKNKVSRAKFAYILDTMASPVCLIMPISSWAATIVACISGSGLPGMKVFLNTIIFNFYPIFAIFTVILSLLVAKDFGLMEKFQQEAKNNSDMSAVKEKQLIETEKIDGKISDLVIPIFVLILASVFMILETGGFFSKNNRHFIEILGEADASLAITFGSFSAIIASFILFVPKTLNFEKFMESISEGTKSMLPAIIMLVLAWSMTSVCQKYLMVGSYIKNIIFSSNFSEKILPLIIFIFSSLLSFSIGSSWGTFGILIPIVVSVCSGIDYDLTVGTIAAVLSGSVLGVNCSPVASIGILVSTGAGCKHLDHIYSQIPYALLAGFASCIAFFILFFSKNLLIIYSVPAIFLVFMYYFYQRLKL